MSGFDFLLVSKLERLVWEFDVSCVPLFLFRLFFSSHLKHVTLSDHGPLMVPLTEVMSCLPMSLEHPSIWRARGGEPLRDAISPFVCRAGPSLRSFGFSEALTEVAFDHLTHLPNLLPSVNCLNPFHYMLFIPQSAPSQADGSVMAPISRGAYKWSTPGYPCTSNSSAECKR